MFALLVGAAAGLATLGAVRLLSDQPEVFPPTIVSLLLILGVVGNALTRRRYELAITDLEIGNRDPA